MGAAPDAYAALYVSHRGITLALDPADAKDLAGAFGLNVIAKNASTHYVKCPSARFAEVPFADRVRLSAGRAVLRSWQGPRWNRIGEAGSAAKMQPTCPIHNYELSASGICMGCDDVAPAL
jgi:hypothetical protein